MEPILGQKYHTLTLNPTNTLYNGAKLIGYEQQHSTNIKLHNIISLTLRHQTKQLYNLKPAITFS